jgi:hypothetical protein
MIDECFPIRAHLMCKNAFYRRNCLPGETMMDASRREFTEK